MEYAGAKDRLDAADPAHPAAMQVKTAHPFTHGQLEIDRKTIGNSVGARSQLDRLMLRAESLEQPLNVKTIVFFDFDGTCGRKGPNDGFGFEWAAQHTRPVIGASPLLVDSLFSPCTARTIPEALKIISTCFTVPIDGELTTASGICVAENGGTLFLSSLPDKQFQKLEAHCCQSGYRLERRPDLGVDIVVIAARQPSDFLEQIVSPALVQCRSAPTFASSLDRPGTNGYEQRLANLQKLAGHSTIEDTRASTDRYATAYLKVSDDSAGRYFVERMTEIASTLGVVMHVDPARPDFPVMTVEFESGLNKGSGIKAALGIYSSLYISTNTVAHIGDAMNDAPGFAAAIALGGKAFLVDSPAMTPELKMAITRKAAGTIFLDGLYDSAAIEAALAQLQCSK